MAVSISMMIGRLGSVVGTNIVGALVGTNCEMTFYISCLAMLSCAILILLLPRNDTSQKSEPVPDHEHYKSIVSLHCN